LKRYYALDLHRLDSDYTLLYLADLVVNLPHDSSVMRAIDPSLAWGYNEYILAVIANQLAVIRYMLAGGKGARPQMIEPPRKEKKVQRVNLDEYLTRLDQYQSQSL